MLTAVLRCNVPVPGVPAACALQLEGEDQLHHRAGGELGQRTAGIGLPHPHPCSSHLASHHRASQAQANYCTAQEKRLQALPSHSPRKVSTGRFQAFTENKIVFNNPTNHTKAANSLGPACQFETSS